MVTVAEGVEDAQTLELLRGCGVDRIQGYLVGRPRPISNRPFWRYEQRAAGGPLSPTAAAPAASAA
jgi:EAL domain-containing protein (putative c-di-GMP-specific phosphodiesterase class I)